jgi:hypothetical protein
MTRIGVSAVALLAGCVVTQDVDNDPVLPGTVELSWQVGPSGCEAAGVTDIEVDVAGVFGTFPCAEGRGSLSVPAGTHDVSMVGLDEGGAARYEGQAYDVVVRAEQVTQVPTVLLSALPAEIHVTWYFDNGRFCSHEENKGVVEVEALLYDADDFVDASVFGDCETGELSIDDVRPGDYTLTLVGRNDAGTITHQGEAALLVEKGDSLDVDVELITQ